MNYFSLLREHARVHTELPAVSSARRSMTYRKLWSRIERATARLQCEWGVGRDDTVVYLGNSHPDALVLFFSLGRSGARFLPLAASLGDSALRQTLQEVKCTLLIVDDDLQARGSACTSHILSSLIATRCPHEPGDVVEDMSRPLLLRCPNREASALQAASLADLREESRPERECLPSEVRLAGFFDDLAFSHTVLPVLEKAGCLVLPA